MHSIKEDAPKKIQVTIGDKVAYVEIMSLKEQIYSVEFPGSEPVFITRIKDNNQQIWISIPQGHNDLAASVGRVIDERELKRKSETEE